MDDHAGGAPRTAHASARGTVTRSRHWESGTAAVGYRSSVGSRVPPAGYVVPVGPSPYPPSASFAPDVTMPLTVCGGSRERHRQPRPWVCGPDLPTLFAAPNSDATMLPGREVPSGSIAIGPAPMAFSARAGSQSGQRGRRCYRKTDA
jgi:hypothetical protein